MGSGRRGLDGGARWGATPRHLATLQDRPPPRSPAFSQTPAAMPPARDEQSDRPRSTKAEMKLKKKEQFEERKK